VSRYHDTFRAAREFFPGGSAVPPPKNPLPKYIAYLGGIWLGLVAFAWWEIEKWWPMEPIDWEAFDELMQSLPELDK